MIILGISGLPNAQRARHERCPQALEIDERICQGLDSAACLLVDGKIIAAAAEERFTGVKGTGELPVNAIEYCLQVAQLQPSDVQVIAHGFDYDRYRRFFPQAGESFDQVYSGKAIIEGLEQAGWKDVGARFKAVEHHVAHAASAYFASGFERALCVVSDGMGEVESLTVFQAQGRTLKKLHGQPIKTSLGLLYSICTRFLGFAFNSDEYKVMGLAAYGNGAAYSEAFNELARFDPATGSINIHWPANTLTDAEEGYPAAMEFLQRTFGIPARAAEDELTDVHGDFAAALQAKFASLLQALVAHWLERTGETAVCLAGGSFLNCKANEALCNLPAVEQAFVQPAAGDDGTAMGAALYHAAQAGEPRIDGFSPYLGPQYSVECIREHLHEAAADGGLQWRYVGLTDEYFTQAARDLADDKIIAWFHGRMEFGPRALGNRSILGRANGQAIKARINGLVKFREPFRPFAPAVLDIDCDRLFESKKLQPTRYMLCTARVREETMDAVSGVAHADASARIQVVSRDVNENFWRLLTEVRKVCGFGCSINTSFNVKGQPLIMAPDVALATFRSIALDTLYMEGFIVWKP
ncbi:carbamoyltransferase [Pseudomonas helmanticensis]|uniref:Carbamoyltransferase n=1 Tax=Pseudomonas helmanticensis TaxID=1471381 RepID=A0ACD2U1S8_9PSED|nr:carbamoyltransferase C-terminal domain-containing protein [Pseudomonas helmanticensis]SMQ23674.1 carbamoyltransferase [Pseudomonas helmanticensis]